MQLLYGQPWTSLAGWAGAASALADRALSSLRQVILVVDDEVGCRQSIREILKAYPEFEVVDACSAAEARQQLKKHEHRICCAFVDLRLSGGSESGGMALTREIRRKYAWVGVVIFSGYAASHERELRDLGVVSILTKGSASPTDILVAAKASRSFLWSWHHFEAHDKRRIRKLLLIALLSMAVTMLSRWMR